ncbi:23S rRNA (uracil(1939)-C(5))-methyltransferase RlmD [Brevibacillus laterosporus]|uniref:23S rRNA (uracil(1939)-C(5))-methyltransferase RlmD n=1 Tax=Brevibacillus laterosporus TaxID=1465 RepID=UPI000CE34DA9|nr:23S rRNA (uracil(1939)-C(5))-methyltransferase RlmD [Brevibacillus laterosporus]MED1665534.1 23S rRNA (uracil(1939)-C(5))-methyltransferase RlmD [Brevibacillus laterosporus]MED1668508.1 23S rRNA (uracil(1939)-C(5))-methyltransferase RlmD [Brevibacillus laterosporus]MED1716577.1 23S rRNA (uracil(1939)-C(5))-methyltransferase RlmD [Brevibacillus laterosporus]PPA84893.1 23S rRNA (uracil(1939)-C(5))-methyltransferase RlmD [Brevibacillus laterosporus]
MRKSGTGKSQRGNKQRKETNRSKEQQPKNYPVQLEQVVDIEITGLNHEAEGVGRYNGYTLFVKGALPGETVKAKVIHAKKNFGYAQLLEITTTSHHREEPPCPVYDRCGGCSLQHLIYSEQLRHKQQIVMDNLRRIGGFLIEGEEQKGLAGKREADALASAQSTATNAVSSKEATAVGTTNGEASPSDKASSSSSVATSHNGEPVKAVKVLPTLGMTGPWRYRNKAQVPIGEENGALIGGFYAEKSHDIIDINECLIQHQANDEVVAKVKRIAERLGIEPYNEAKHTGLLRHVVAKVGAKTGDLMVVLITTEAFLPEREQLIQLIRAELSGVKSIVQNVNERRTNVIFGDQTFTLWGDDVIYDYIGPIKFAISARSFYQVNPEQTDVLYSKTLEYAGLEGDETVIDAYCGIGTISLFLAQKAKRVYGVEIVPEAIADAKKNAELNGLENVSFEVGPAEVVIPNWRKQGIVADVIVVDPPRKGCDEALLTTILQMQPKKVVYVSCNPSTLARDLKVLAEKYEVVEVQPVDMFPHTGHVESVACLIYKGF